MKLIFELAGKDTVLSKFSNAKEGKEHAEIRIGQETSEGISMKTEATEKGKRYSGRKYTHFSKSCLLIYILSLCL